MTGTNKGISPIPINLMVYSPHGNILLLLLLIQLSNVCVTVTVNCLVKQLGGFITWTLSYCFPLGTFHCYFPFLLSIVAFHCDLQLYRLLTGFNR